MIKEGKTISELIDNKTFINEEEIQEYHSTPSHVNHSPQSEKESSKKKMSESEDDKSSSFLSQYTKFSQIEENKPKMNICILRYSDLLNLLNINKINNNENIINCQEIEENDKNLLKIRINELENEIKSKANIETKKSYLRRMVCLKLYKALHFALKNFTLEENEIRHICLYLEIQGRIRDSDMGDKYKEFIENIFKKISKDNNNKIKND